MVKAGELDRKKVCPHLLRIFIKRNSFHRPDLFHGNSGKMPVDDELQIYTWPDGTLREITDLVGSVKKDAQNPDSIILFAKVFPDKRGQMKQRQIGQTKFCTPCPDDNRTLDELGVEIGDYLTIQIKF